MKRVLVLLIFICVVIFTNHAQQSIAASQFADTYWLIQRDTSETDFDYYLLSADGKIQIYNPWVKPSSNPGSNSWKLDNGKIIFSINDGYATYTSDSVFGGGSQAISGSAVNKYDYSWKWHAEKIISTNVLGDFSKEGCYYVEIKKSENSQAEKADDVDIWFYSEEFVSSCQGFEKIGYIVLRNIRSHLTLAEAETIAFKYKGDLVIRTRYHERDAYLVFKVTGIPGIVLTKEKLTGLWTRDNNNSSGWYPGTLSIAADRFVYRSHYQDMFQMFWQSGYVFENSGFRFTESIDLWPAGVRRGIDGRSTPPEGEIWDIMPIKADAYGKITVMLVLKTYVNPNTGKTSRISTVYERLSDDPGFAVKAEIDYLK